MTTERIDIVVTSKGARTVRREIDKIGTGATSAQGAVKLLRRALGGLGAGLVLTGIVRTLAQFSQEMSTVRAVTGATEDQFKSLRDTAKDLGTTTRFSATQAAEGMTFLARAGFTTEQVLASIGDTLNLAQAGALELGAAADIASNVLKGFNLEAEETTRVVDVLVNTANKANTDVEQLGQAMSFLAPAADAVGVSVELASAAVGALSDAGVQSTRAGTALRQIFIKLIDVTPKAQGILERYGLTTGDVDVASRGLVPVLETLRKANIGLSEATALVGARQAANLLILTKSIPKISELEKANIGAGGTAAEVARIMDDNLNGALISVKSAAEGVILAFGDLGSESLLTKAMRGLAAGLRFVAANMDDVAQAAKIVGAALFAMKIPVITAQFKALTLVLLANPFTALLVGVTALTAALTVFQDEVKLTADGTVTLGDAWDAVGNTLGSTVTDAINGLGGSFANFDEIVASVVNNFSKGLVVLAATANGVVKAMIAAFDDFPRALKSVARSAWNGFLSITQGALNIFLKAVNKALEFLGVSKELELFDFNGLKAEGETAGDTLGQAFKQGFDEVLIETLQVSATRRAKEAAAAGGGGSAGVPGPGKSTVDPRIAARAAAAKTSAAEFAKILESLKTEGELLKLNNRDREIRVAILDAESELKRKLTDNERGLLEAVVANNLELQTQRDLLDEIKGPAEEYGNKLEALNALLAKGKISTEEFANAQRDMRITLLEGQTDLSSGVERTFLKMQKNAEDSASQIEDVLTSAFKGAEDAFVDFVKGGELSFEGLVDTMLDQLTRLAFQGALAQGAGALGLGGSGGGGGIFESLFSGLGGSGGGGLSGLFSFLPGFANGGGGMVGPGTSPSIGGVDNRLVALRARDGERVTVTPPGASSERPVNVQFNINTPDADSFKASQGQIFANAQLALQRAGRRNN